MLAKPDKANPDEIAAAFRSYLASTRLWPGRNRFYRDQGTINLDSHYGPYRERVEAFMPTLGWHRDKDWVSRVFEGADHNEAAWRERLTVPLEFLLGPEAGSNTR